MLLAALERARLSTTCLDAGILDPHRPLRPGGFWNRFGQRFTSAASWKEVAYWPVLCGHRSITFARRDRGSGSEPACSSPLAALRPPPPQGKAHLLIANVSSSSPDRRAVRGRRGAVARRPVGHARLTRHGRRARPRAPRPPPLGRTRGARRRPADDPGPSRRYGRGRAAPHRARPARRRPGRASSRSPWISAWPREDATTIPWPHGRLLDDAHQEAKRAIVELRDLGSAHPSWRCLADRGLDPALSSLVSRARVPVELTVDVPERPPATTESIAYFVVAEALTNITKHAHASAVGQRRAARIDASCSRSPTTESAAPT